MWPGPYGDLGSRKYLLSSLDDSLQRMGLDYVDIFYSHRFDPDTPLEETMGALDTAVRQGKALYVGISSYSDERTREAAAILKDLGTPLLIHQPSYSMLNRWIEPELLDAVGDVGAGCIAFTVLAQGMLTSKYLDGIPDGSRAAGANATIDKDLLNEENLARVRGLNEIAEKRGQSLAQMALAWALRDERMTSLVIGASSVKQLEENVKALDNLDFTDDELEADRRVRRRLRHQPLGGPLHRVVLGIAGKVRSTRRVGGDLSRNSQQELREAGDGAVLVDVDVRRRRLLRQARHRHHVTADQDHEARAGRQPDLAYVQRVTERCTA